MAGNLWEWVWDWSATYSSATETNPTGSSEVQTSRILRGCSWRDDTMRCTQRGNGSPFGSGFAGGGFRVARNNPADPRPVTFIKTYGSELSVDLGNSVSVCSTGDYLICGNSNIDDDSNTNVYLSKIDNKGNQLWYKTFGGVEKDEGYSVTQLIDGSIIICGNTRSYGAGENDIYLIKTDSDGNQIWYKTFGGVYVEIGQSVSKTADGGFVVCGNIRLTSTNADVYLLKFDSNGDLQWDKMYGGARYEEGSYACQTKDGGYIICGMTESFTDVVGDIYMLKTDSAGNEEWYKTFGSTDFEGAHSVKQTQDNGYIIAGWKQVGKSTNTYLIKTDTSGNYSWSKIFTDGIAQGSDCIIENEDGNLFICGLTSSYGAGGSDALLLKLDAEGNVVWYKTYGGTGADVGCSIKRTSDNGFVICGSTAPVSATWDALLIKTDINGNVMGGE